MKWTQVDLTVPEDLEEPAIAAMAGAGCSSVQVIREEDLPEFDDRWALPDPEPRRRPGSCVVVRGYLPPDEDPREQLRQALTAASADGDRVSIQLESIEDPGWDRRWRKYHRRARVGTRLVITPTWSRGKGRPGEIEIVVDPGMAFGTGQHATTRLCLAALERWLSPGDAVIDVGCGSGILSIAAVKLGAARVTALDLDRIAVLVASENVALNGVAGAVTVLEGTLEERGPQVNLILANILAGVVIDLAPAALARLATPGGILIASGIANAQEAEVEAALRAHQLTPVETRRSRGWSCIAARTA